MIYRHEVRIGGTPRYDDDSVLMSHQRDPHVTSLEAIPELFSHWHADWEHAVHLKSSGIFYVISYQESTPSFLIIWYDPDITGGF